MLSAVNLSFAADSFSQSDLEGDWKSHAIFSSAENWEGWQRADMAVDGETASPSNIEDSDEHSVGIGETATISIDSDGIITMPTDNSFEGILNSDKDFIVVTSGYPGIDDNPGLGIFVKRTETSFTTADFEGDWIGHFISSSATGWEGWERIDMTADSIGVFTLGEMENSDEDSGTIGKEVTFSISSDGIVTLSESEEESLEGIMSPDKNIIVLTDEYSSDNPELAILVKQTETSFTTADLEGDWKIHAIYSSDNAADWEGWERGDAAIDGSGKLAFNGTDSDEQTLEGTATLSIGSNGIITSADGNSFEGIMSPDKTVIVFTSGGSGGDDPRLTIAVKRVETEDGGSDDSGGCFITSLYQ
ncbi:MAG: hypothetical protein J7L89_03110 [Bacteroidales bacterium]|nr:hypothetical protein [Bacteroidales bacterium]